MTLVTWPSELSPRIITMQLINQTRSMNQSLSGIQQVNSSLAQRWRLNLDFNTLKRHQILPFRAFVASMEGRLNYTDVPVWDKRMIDQHQIDKISVTHSDTSEFSDDSGYSQSSESTVSVSVTRGSKTLSVSSSTLPGRLLPGVYFNIGSRLHICTSYDGSTLGFQPAIRETGSFNLSLTPILRARFSSDEMGDLPLEFGLRGSPSLEFVEVLD